MIAETFDGQYRWHPAADDHQLARACTDLRAGRYFSAHEVLKEARSDFELRAHRSLVLASEAADSDLVERWVAEEPSAESALMWARVAVLRAVRMSAKRDNRLGALTDIAQNACERAAETFPDDPTPLVAQLAIAHLLRVSDPAPQEVPGAPPGPWGIFTRILRSAPSHREAHHRMLAYFFVRHGGSGTAAWDVALFLSQRAPLSSALRLLPFVVLLAEHDSNTLVADRIWEQPAWHAAAATVYQNWFSGISAYRFTPVLDLSYLAHALFMARRRPEARKVFMTMGPYASRMPWAAFGDPVKQLTIVRRSCGLPVPAGIHTRRPVEN
ncbi:MAG: hypothetical protein ACRDP6_35665 [Actinoallomurus sp.]